MFRIGDKVKILADAGFKDDIPEGSVGLIAKRIPMFGPGEVIDLYGVTFLGGVRGEIFYFESTKLFLIGDGEDLTVLPYSLESTQTHSGSHGMEGIF